MPKAKKYDLTDQELTVINAYEIANNLVLNALNNDRAHYIDTICTTRLGYKEGERRGFTLEGKTLVITEEPGVVS
jgi:hypothetical protein